MVDNVVIEKNLSMPENIEKCFVIKDQKNSNVKRTIPTKFMLHCSHDSLLSIWENNVREGW